MLAIWNLVDPDLVKPDKSGASKSIRFSFRGLKKKRLARISRLDARHGDPLAAYQAMGNPRYPTQEQIRQLNLASELPTPEIKSLENQMLQIDLPVNGLALIELY